MGLTIMGRSQIGWKNAFPILKITFSLFFFLAFFFLSFLLHCQKHLYNFIFVCLMCHNLMEIFHFNVIYATINTTNYILYGWNHKVYFTHVSWDVASYVKKPTFPCSDWRFLGSLSITLSLQFLMRNVSHDDNKVMENDWNYYCNHFPLESENFVIVLETNVFIQILDIWFIVFCDMFRLNNKLWMYNWWTSIQHKGWHG
jgi:hypothetical protein